MNTRFVFHAALNVYQLEVDWAKDGKVVTRYFKVITGAKSGLSEPEYGVSMVEQDKNDKDIRQIEPDSPEWVVIVSEVNNIFERIKNETG